MCRFATVFLAALAALGCEPDPRVTRLRLEPPEAIGCRPTELTSVRVEALADLPPDQRPSVAVEVSVDRTIELFPDATEAVAVRAEGFVLVGGRNVPWTGGGIATLVEGELAVPLLRFGRACALADPAARLPAGAAATALPERGLFVAGGRDGGSAASQAVAIVHPGEPLAASLSLLVPRAGGTASVVGGGRVLVAGGTGLRTDSVELFDVTEGAEERVQNEELLASRRDHVAIPLPDRSVLLAGGRDADGAVRADAERVWVDELEVTSELRVGLGLVPRAGHRALVLDDGTVLLVGGVDDAGAPVGAVERFDPASETVDRVAELPARADAAFAALAGGRVAQVGGRDGDDAWTGDVVLLVEGGTERVDLPGVAVVPGTDRPIEAPAAVGLSDGRLLVVGRDADTRSPVARLIDPAGTREEPSIDPSRVAERLVVLADGTIAEGDAAGLSLLRVDLATPFSDPPASIFPGQIEQLDALSLDAPGRWTADADGLTAVTDGARFDVPSSRFGDVRVELDAVVDGDESIELLLTTLEAAPAVVTITSERVAYGGCEVPRDGTDTVTVERTSARLAVSTPAGSSECAFDVGGRIGVAVRARGGAAAGEGPSIRRIAVARLAAP